MRRYGCVADGVSTARQDPWRVLRTAAVRHRAPGLDPSILTDVRRVSVLVPSLRLRRARDFHASPECTSASLGHVPEIDIF